MKSGASCDSLADDRAVQGNVHPVISCGGSGTRLWPLSREQHPKQLHAMTGDATLLQATVTRLQSPAGARSTWAKPVIVCNKEYRFAVGEQLRAIGSPPGALVLEPVGRNTAPALTLAALLLAEMAGEPEPLLLVAPANHMVKDCGAFHCAMERARPLADAGHVVTFGVRPFRAEAGFGYIRQGERLADSGSENAPRSAVHRKARSVYGKGIFRQRPIPVEQRHVHDARLGMVEVD